MSEKARYAQHDSAMKLPLALVPTELEKEVARVMQFGAQKYGRDDWRLGFPWMELLNSCQRHINNFLEGRDRDHESGCSHIAHAATNLGFLLYCMRYFPELDDRPKPPKRGDNG